MGREILLWPLDGSETASFSKRSFLLLFLLLRAQQFFRCRITLDGDTRQIAPYFLTHKHVLELKHPFIPLILLVLVDGADERENNDLVLALFLQLNKSTTHRCTSMILGSMNMSMEPTLHQIATATSPALTSPQTPLPGLFQKLFRRKYRWNSIDIAHHVVLGSRSMGFGSHADLFAGGGCGKGGHHVVPADRQQR